MSELRYEPIYGRRVIIAPERLLRPNALVTASHHRVSNPLSSTHECPFCRGNESMTPTAVLTLPNDSQVPWQVRVVPNRYPAVTMDPADVGEPAAAGTHEVVIESAEHKSSWSQLPQEQRRLILRAYRDRLTALHGIAGIRWGLVFKNQGVAAGASQEHVHSQIIGMTHSAPATARAVQYAAAHWQQHRLCVFCQLAQDELLAASRIVESSDQFVAFCPAASRFAFEIWIVPRFHSARFEDAADDQLDQLELLLARILAQLENSIPNAAFNLAIYSAPFDTYSHDHYHWHIVICPRLAGLAGLELFADVFVNPVAPESAAETLRSKSQ